MFVLKGDTVKLKSGETGIIIDTWGVARDWVKIKTHDGKTLICMASIVETIIKRK